MAQHFNNLNSRVRARLNRPDVGQLPNANMLLFANEGLLEIANTTQLPEARVVVCFNNGAVTLAEEDWPGTELVGIPTYAFGIQAAFYLAYGLKIHAIHEIENTGTAAAPVWNELYEIQLGPKRHDDIWGDTAQAATYVDWYGVYRWPSEASVTEPSYDYMAIWFDQMFDYSAATTFRYFQVKYNRWGPVLDIDFTTSPVTYTQYWTLTSPRPP
jgi:hypothetical protein